MGHNRVARHRKKQVPVPPICTVLFSTWISELLRKNLKNSVTKWSTRTPIKKITTRNSSIIPKQTIFKVDLGKQDQKLCQLSRGKTWGRSLVAVGPEIESANIYTNNVHGLHNCNNNNNKSIEIIRQKWQYSTLNSAIVPINQYCRLHIGFESKSEMFPAQNREFNSIQPQSRKISYTYWWIGTGLQ